jgi:hypothetical protein
MTRATLAAVLTVLTFTGCEGLIVGGGRSPLPGQGDGPSAIASGRDCSKAGASPGHYTLRRLTNREYSNTVQALLFTTKDPGATFQESLPGASGFTNDSKALAVYSTLVAGYYDTAVSLAQEVIASKGQATGAYGKLVTCAPTQSTCARDTVAALGRRALRRAVGPTDLDPTNGLMAVFNASGSFDQGLYDVIVALLMHPEFLMIPVVSAQSQDPNAVFALTDDELASRLSYFLWQSMPDDALMAVADDGTLHTPTVLAAQVKRMVADPRAVNLKTVLRDEWADLSTLAKVDLTQVGQTNALRDSMIGETDAFFADLITNDRSPLTVLGGKQAFVNKQLADFYGLTFPAGANPASFVAVASTRSGLGSQAAVLTNTSGGNPTFTNPIKRGHWIAKKLYCNEPPPPPPNVPPLPASGTANATIRQRLSAHLNQPACVGCHQTMDTFGLGAESYDSFGRWRTTYADGTAVDATGQMPGTGVAFTDATSMYADLATDAQAKSCVVQQFMKLATSRPLSGLDDLCAADTVSQTALTDGAHFSDFVVSVTLTNQFLQQTGEAP